MYRTQCAGPGAWQQPWFEAVPGAYLGTREAGCIYPFCVLSFERSCGRVCAGVREARQFELRADERFAGLPHGHGHAPARLRQGQGSSASSFLLTLKSLVC